MDLYKTLFSAQTIFPAKFSVPLLLLWNDDAMLSFQIQYNMHSVITQWSYYLLYKQFQYFIDKAPH